MTDGVLIVFVEGLDDERFFQKVLKPKLDDRYQYVQLFRCRGKPDKKIAAFIRSARSAGWECLYVEDIDVAPCVTRKKEEIIDHFALELDEVVVVVREIEGWYLAGLNQKACKAVGLKYVESSDDIIKEQFNSMMPGRYDSLLDFKLEMLKYQDLSAAAARNVSLAYFIRKHII